MRFVPRASVRTSVIVAILLTVVLSWVISGGVANYLNYRNFRAFRAEMMKHRDQNARPIPEPKFGFWEFLTGRPPIPLGAGETREPHMGPPPDMIPRPGMPPDVGPGGPPLERRHHGFDFGGLAMRLGVVLGLAVAAGLWMGRKFARPLAQLAKGADAFQSGNFDYRIPRTGTHEFAAVATAMNEMASRVSDQITRLETDAERRRQFLADVAHELRSPVTTLGTMIAALQDGLADEPARREFALSALAANSQRLSRLVQDLMDLAKLEVTELPLERRETDLRELVSAAVRSHEPEAAEAGITLSPVEAGPVVMSNVDPDRLAQVMDNIIENAIHYAGSGAEVKVVVTDDNPVRITVSDTGKGIKAADLPYVLDPFYRADAARTPNDSHSGLGLSIASKLIGAHGGKLTIESEEGKGTTVVIWLARGPEES
jgi:signal transduction histidine kinase